MPHQRFDLHVETGTLSDGHSWRLAATVHLPERVDRDKRPPLAVCLPGGGSNRRYFDLREPGYSQAEHHVARGAVVVAIDHLRTGESDIPALEDASLQRAAEANHAALQTLLERLRAGALCDGIGPVAPAAVIGVGQSMGGHIAVLMQANHRSFDGLAVLGTSVVCTRLPAKVAGDEICLMGKKDFAEEMAALATFDTRFAFHWEDVPERFAAAYGSSLTMEAGDEPPPYWRSMTAPDAWPGVLPGFISREAASVTVPVLIGMGERDLCQDPVREVAAYMSSKDVAYFIAPRMAHVHNFAGTRELLWRRLDAFIAQIADMR